MSDTPHTTPFQLRYAAESYRSRGRHDVADHLERAADEIDRLRDEAHDSSSGRSRCMTPRNLYVCQMSGCSRDRDPEARYCDTCLERYEEMAHE